MFRSIWNFFFGTKEPEAQIKKPDVSGLNFPNKPVVPKKDRVVNPTPVHASTPPKPPRRTLGSSSLTRSSDYDTGRDDTVLLLLMDALNESYSNVNTDSDSNWSGSGGETGGGGASASWSESSPASSYSSSSDSCSSSSSSYSSSSSDSYSSSSSYDSSSSSYDSGSSSSSCDNGSW